MKRKKGYRVALFVLTLFFGIFLNDLFPAKVFASDGRAIILSPMDQRIVLMPGEVYHGSVTIANPAEAVKDLYYLASVGSYSVVPVDGGRDDYGGADLTTRTSMNEIVDWITINNPSGVVRPDENHTLSFDIRVPINAPAGGQYATILVREDTEDSVEKDSIAVKEIMQMAHVIFAEVAGETNRVGMIVENSIPSFVLASPLSTTSIVRNDGNTHTEAEYILQVWPLFSNEEVCTNEEESEKSWVLPKTSRYHSSECTLPLFGIFRAKQTVRIFGEESVVEKIVFVCPIWLMFLIVFLVTLVIIWLFTRSKARKGSKKSKSEE